MPNWLLKEGEQATVRELIDQIKASKQLTPLREDFPKLSHLMLVNRVKRDEDPRRPLRIVIGGLDRVSYKTLLGGELVDTPSVYLVNPFTIRYQFTGQGEQYPSIVTPGLERGSARVTLFFDPKKHTWSPTPYAVDPDIFQSLVQKLTREAALAR